MKHQPVNKKFFGQIRSINLNGIAWRHYKQGCETVIIFPIQFLIVYPGII